MSGSFYGWYLKCQSNTQTLAVIPAVHGAGRKCTCSIQFITDEGAWTVTFPREFFVRRGNVLRIGKNQFRESGIQLNVKTPDLVVRGKVKFGALKPLKYDIMGPFAFVPFLECRHSVWSMQHSVKGEVCINGKKYSFCNDVGYWEGDSGRSFPKEYAWTQCSFSGGSLMLSVADIPMVRMHFTGIIGVVLWKGKEYRVATYLGARLVELRDGRIRIVQGDLELEAYLLEKSAHPLKAPTCGEMIRTIHESATCHAFYRFKKSGKTLFSFETKRASFEYEYPC